MKTKQPKLKEVVRNWHLIEAKDKVLGRLSSEVVKLLMGKNKVSYAPFMDMGDNVVIINAAKVVLTGKKEKQKIYYSHSGYPGGLKAVPFSKLKKEHPERIIEKAIKGMLPGNRLRDKRMRRLFVFSGERHPYQSKFKAL